MVTHTFWKMCSLYCCGWTLHSLVEEAKLWIIAKKASATKTLHSGLMLDKDGMRLMHYSSVLSKKFTGTYYIFRILLQCTTRMATEWRKLFCQRLYKPKSHTTEPPHPPPPYSRSESSKRRGPQACRTKPQPRRGKSHLRPKTDQFTGSQRDQKGQPISTKGPSLVRKELQPLTNTPGKRSHNSKLINGLWKKWVQWCPDLVDFVRNQRQDVH